MTSTSYLIALAKEATTIKTHFIKTLKSYCATKREMKQHKRVKTYVTQLGEIDQALSKKLEEVDKASLLVSAILNGEEKFNFEPLHKLRVEKRTQLLEEIRSKLGTQTPLKKKSTKKVREKQR
ncbi:MAG: hypothetical protein QM734_12130 [Cyclobacteriaceae bacterium]